MSEEKRELLKDLLELRKENIKGIRRHMYQMLLLSGAIAAFLMPVYASDIISEIQKIIVPISMACFLLAIVVRTFPKF